MKITDVHLHPRIVPRLKAFLDKAPVDEVFTTQELIERLNCAIQSRHRFALREYTTKIVTKGYSTCYWGCPAAIRKLVTHLNGQAHENPKCGETSKSLDVRRGQKKRG